MEGFIAKCMTYLKNNSDNSTSVLNIVQILSEFLDRFEGKKPIKPEYKSNSWSQVQTWTINVVARKVDQSQTQGTI